MGLLRDLFGGSGEKIEPSKGDAEREARKDYVSEYRDKGKDPIPREAPDWAKDIGKGEGRGKR